MRKPVLKIGQSVTFKDTLCVEKVAAYDSFDSEVKCWTIYLENSVGCHSEDEFEEYKVVEENIPDEYYTDNVEEVHEVILNYFKEYPSLFSEIKQEIEGYGNSSTYDCLGFIDGCFNINRKDMYEDMHSYKYISPKEFVHLYFESDKSSSETVIKPIESINESFSKLSVKSKKIF